MKFSAQPSKTEIGYCAEMNCLRDSGEKRAGNRLFLSSALCCLHLSARFSTSISVITEVVLQQPVIYSMNPAQEKNMGGLSVVF